MSLDSQGVGSRSGKINYTGDIDVLSLVATRTGRMQVDLTPVANKKNRVTGGLWAYDAWTSLLALDTDPADIPACVSFDVVSGQTYYVKVASLGGETGGYTALFSTTAPVIPAPGPDPTPDPVDPGDYLPGISISAVIEMTTDGREFIVLGTVGADTITLSQSGDSIWLTSPSGSEVYSGRPLFVDRPEYDDINQGALGDCYLMAALSSMADSDPSIIRQLVAPLGDGSYAVRFHRDGQEVYLRVDADLPAYSETYSARLRYANFTPDGEIWVASLGDETKQAGPALGGPVRLVRQFLPWLPAGGAGQSRAFALSAAPSS